MICRLKILVGQREITVSLADRRVKYLRNHRWVEHILMRNGGYRWLNWCVELMQSQNGRVQVLASTELAVPSDA